MKIIIDCTNDEIITRELSDEELAQQKLDEKDIAKAESTLTAQAEAKAVAKAALLDRLGITADEAKLLLS
jgi:adenylate kinase